MIALLLTVGFRASVFSGEAIPTLDSATLERIQDSAEIISAEVIKVEQHILHKNRVVDEALKQLEKRLLPLLETDGEALKNFVENSRVITSISLRVIRSYRGSKNPDEIIVIQVVDEVGDLCPHYKQLPVSGDFLEANTIWAFAVEEGPFSTKVTSIYWTTKKKWHELEAQK